MTCEWTIDTWTLYQAAGTNPNLEAVEFLARVARRHSVAFDHEGHIEREYRACLAATGSSVLKEWFKLLIGRKARVFHPGQLRSVHKQAFDRLRFDPSDRPFVAVCFQSSSKLLVTEESDYSNATIAYLGQEMGIQVLSITRALEQAEQAG